jgi:hypothetical protein
VVAFSRHSNWLWRRKLGIPFGQGVEDKHTALRSLSVERKVGLDQIAYVGNDVNDLSCMASAGCGVAVADAHPEVLRRADLILKATGGRGAIRELCDSACSGMNRAVQVGDRWVGEGHPTSIVAEIGINHNGSLEKLNEPYRCGQISKAHPRALCSCRATRHHT